VIFVSFGSDQCLFTSCCGYYIALIVISVGCFMKESLKPGFVKRTSIKLKQVDRFLGANQWFAGDRVRLY